MLLLLLLLLAREKSRRYGDRRRVTILLICILLIISLVLLLVLLLITVFTLDLFSHFCSRFLVLESTKLIVKTRSCTCAGRIPIRKVSAAAHLYGALQLLMIRYGKVCIGTLL